MTGLPGPRHVDHYITDFLATEDLPALAAVCTYTRALVAEVWTRPERTGRQLVTVHVRDTAVPQRLLQRVRRLQVTCAVFAGRHHPEATRTIRRLLQACAAAGRTEELRLNGPPRDLIAPWGGHVLPPWPRLRALTLHFDDAPYDLSRLGDMTQLTSLTLRMRPSAAVRDLGMLNKLTNLTCLRIAVNHVRGLDPRHMHRLRRVVSNSDDCWWMSSPRVEHITLVDPRPGLTMRVHKHIRFVRTGRALPHVHTYDVVLVGLAKETHWFGRDGVLPNLKRYRLGGPRAASRVESLQALDLPYAVEVLPMHHDPFASM